MSTEKPEEKKPEDKFKWTASLSISLIALVVSGLSFVSSGIQCSLNKAAQDRATGKIKAQFEFVKLGNTDEKTLARFTRKTTLGFTAVHLDTVEAMRQWEPFVELKNTGEEVIDGVRVQEVRWLRGNIVLDKDPGPMRPNPASM